MLLFAFPIVTKRRPYFAFSAIVSVEVLGRHWKLPIPKELFSPLMRAFRWSIWKRIFMPANPLYTHFPVRLCRYCFVKAIGPRFGESRRKPFLMPFWKTQPWRAFTWPFLI